MSNPYFHFKQFTVHHDRCAMKVTTDACLFGAWVAANHASKQNVQNVLDIGTGSGLLALMFAQQHPEAFIDAIEIDADATQQAHENFNSSTWRNHLTAIHADAGTYPFTRKYDVIISNPPFYEHELQSGNEKKNVAHHHAGLLLDELLPVIKSNLAEAGNFYLLLPFKRNVEINSLFSKHDLHVAEKALVSQSVDHSHFRIMLRGTHRLAENIQMKEIAITNEKKEYTPEFVSLLKDYYLYL